MSDGAITSTPARANETAVLARIAKVASLKISYSVNFAVAASIAFDVASALAAISGSRAGAPKDGGCCDACITPQCPCDVYSHKEIAARAVSLGTARLIA